MSNNISELTLLINLGPSHLLTQPGHCPQKILMIIFILIKTSPIGH